MKPEQAEIARLRREVSKLRAERDIPKNRGLLREGIDVEFARRRAVMNYARACNGAMKESEDAERAALAAIRSAR